MMSWLRQNAARHEALFQTSIIQDAAIKSETLRASQGSSIEKAYGYDIRRASFLRIDRKEQAYVANILLEANVTNPFIVQAVLAISANFIYSLGYDAKALQTPPAISSPNLVNHVPEFYFLPQNALPLKPWLKQMSKRFGIEDERELVEACVPDKTNQMNIIEDYGAYLRVDPIHQRHVEHLMDELEMKDSMARDATLSTLAIHEHGRLITGDIALPNIVPSLDQIQENVRQLVAV